MKSGPAVTRESYKWVSKLYCVTVTGLGPVTGSHMPPIGGITQTDSVTQSVTECYQASAAAVSTAAWTYNL